MSNINSLFAIGSSGAESNTLSPIRQFPLESVGQIQPKQTLETFKLPKPIEVTSHNIERSSQAGSSAETWGHMVQQMVKDVNSAQKNAGHKVRDVLSGGPTTVHEAMIASQKSGVAFQVLAEVRNKALETYKEIMRIQV